MPGGDRTGPTGMGPMTGRAAGYCAGYGMPGFMNGIGGRGFLGRGFRGRGGRGGRGWRNRFYATGLTGWQRAAMGWPQGAAVPPAGPYAVPGPAPVTGQQQLDALKAQAEYLQDALEDIRKQVQEIEAQAKKDQAPKDV